MMNSDPIDEKIGELFEKLLCRVCKSKYDNYECKEIKCPICGGKIGICFCCVNELEGFTENGERNGNKRS